MPSASARSVWLFPSINRRMRTRLPTCLSIKLRDFFAILEPPSHINVAANRIRLRNERAAFYSIYAVLWEQMAGYIVAASCATDRVLLVPRRLVCAAVKFPSHVPIEIAAGPEKNAG
jgi:hypothetical protein